MQTFHRASDTSMRHSQCLHCRQEIMLAPRVGWIELYPGQSYDVCPADESGRHQPDPESGSERPYWMAGSSHRVVDVRIPGCQ